MLASSWYADSDAPRARACTARETDHHWRPGGTGGGRGLAGGDLWVPETRHMSGDLLIFVEEAAEAVVSLDLA